MTIDDARVKFYLKHREQLQEWFELRPAVATAIDEWLLALEGDVQNLASELGGDVEVVADTHEDQGWPGFYLRRTWWPNDSPRNKDGTFVAVGMQWVRGKTLLGPSTTPYVGIRGRDRTPLMDAIRRDPEIQQARRQRKASSTTWWPALEFVPVAVDEPFPVQADAYRARLVEAIRTAWVTYAPFVDRAVAGPRIAPGT